ncbi:MAG: hypothetical protein L0177_16435, partial [Chloroflexi bacterium]|nr:hypothetical protein [Chloroflexota bacterium]
MNRSRILAKALIIGAMVISVIRFPAIPSSEIASPAVVSPPSVSAEVRRDERFEAVAEMLALIPTGRQALETIEKYDVEVRFEGGQGSFYHRTENFIVIDSGKNDVDAALALVHEAYHALNT